MATGAAVRAGRAFVELYTDNSKLRRGLKKAQYRIRRFSASVRAMGMRVAAAGAMIATPLALAVREAGQFEAKMAKVSTMLDEPAQHMARFRGELERLSIEMGESAETLSDGLYKILSASIQPAKAMDVLRQATEAAKAGFTDTETAADALTTVLNSYGMEAERVAEVSDILFTVQRRGKTTFGEIAPQIGMVASTAANAGVPLEELAAMLAQLTRNGLQTENAITAINRTIASFMKPSKEAAEYAEKLGIDLSTATLKADGLFGVFQRMSQLSPDELAKVFPNIRAIRGVIPAMNNLEGGLKDVAAAQNSTGATSEALNKVMDTSAQQWEQLKQSVMSFMRTLGGPLLSALGNIAGGLQDTAADMKEWINANQGAVKSLAALAGVLVGGGGLLVVLGTLGTVLASLVNPIGAIVSVVGLAAGGIATWKAKQALFNREIETTRKSIQDHQSEVRSLTERYKELSTATNKTATEKAELSEIIGRLRKEFPEYASEIDGTKESVDRLADSLGDASSAAKQVALRDEQKRLEELKEQYQKVATERSLTAQNIKMGAYGQLRDEEGNAIGPWSTEEEIEQAQARARQRMMTKYYRKQAKVNDIAEKITETTRRRLQLKKDLGKASEEELAQLRQLTKESKKQAEAEDKKGEEAVTPTEQDVAKRKQLMEQVEKDIQRLRLKQIDDEHKRRMKRIRQEWNERFRQLEKLGAKSEQLRKVQEASGMEMMLARERQQERVRKKEEKLADEVARARIKATKEGVKERLALLERERKQRLQDAREAGFSDEMLAKIEELYRYRRQLARQTTRGEGAAGVTGSVRGTFRSAAIGGMGTGSPLDRTAKATEETAENTQRIKEEAREGGTFN